MDSSAAASAADDAADVDATAGQRITRNECNDIFNEHFISLRLDLSTFSTVGSVREATVQYSTCRSSASGVDRSVAADRDGLLKTTPDVLITWNEKSN